MKVPKIGDRPANIDSPVETECSIAAEDVHKGKTQAKVTPRSKFPMGTERSHSKSSRLLAM